MVVEECAQTEDAEASCSREMKSEGSMWDEFSADYLEDYRFECLYCDFKTLNEKLWTAHVNYLHRSPQKQIEQDEECGNIDPETLNSEDVESKLEEIDKTTCFKNECESDDNSSPREEIDLDEEEKRVDLVITQKCEDIESKLHEEIDLGQHKTTCFTDADDKREFYENPSLGKEVDVNEERKNIDLDEIKRTKVCRINKAKSDENDAAPDWADINVLENPDIQDVSIARSIAKSKKLFFCEQCFYKSEWKESVKKHVLVMHTPPEKIKWFNCDKCSYKSKLRGYLTRHVKLKHPGMMQHNIQLFYCDKCDHKCNVKSNLKRHIVRKHGEGKNVDHGKKQKNGGVELKLQDENKANVDDERESDENTSRGKEEGNNNVDLDTIITNDHREFNKDKSHENDILQNEDVADAAPDGTDINVEDNNEIQDVPIPKSGKLFYCGQCSYKSYRKGWLKKHVFKMHTAPEKIKWFNCDKCSFKCNLREYLINHVKLKHPEMMQHIQLLDCDKCDYKCKIRRNLEGHILKYKHLCNMGPWCCCTHCTLRIKYEESLKRHMLVHTVGKEGP